MTADAEAKQTWPWPRHRSQLLWVLTVGAALACHGCTGGNGPRGVIDHPTSIPTMSVSPSATVDPTQALILRQYEGFWRALAPASQAPATARARMLGQFAAEPALGSMLRGIAAERAKGHVFYGLNRPRPTVRGLNETSGMAVVDDCQDSSHAGVRELSSGSELTVGVVRNHVVVTMRRMPDKIWRVVFITYPKSPC